MRRMRVAVGSTNPVKIDAVRIAFESMWPDQQWEVCGVSLDSGVRAQPMSDEESLTGARNRARRALSEPDADYGVGLEGGLQRVGDWWFDNGWIVVIDKSGREGIGATAKIAVPPHMMKLVARGMEVGEAVDTVFQQHNSKQAAGHFGLLTKNRITRTRAYADGVLSALARFIHPDLFAEDG